MGKDVDFTNANENIRVGEDLKEKLVKQIESDSAFLRDNNVIDYSLLLGIHNVGSYKNKYDEEFLEEDNKAVQCKDTTTSPSDWGGLLSHDKRQRYFFGIIDILTPYDTRKRVEHHVKA